MWTDMSQPFCYTLRDSTKSCHPSPQSRSAGIKVVQAAAQQIHTEGGSDAPNEPTRLHQVSGCHIESLADSVTILEKQRLTVTLPLLG
jgi:hypothetical protein